MTLSVHLDTGSDEIPDHLKPFTDQWYAALNATLAHLFNGEQKPQDDAALLYKMAIECTAALVATGIQDERDLALTISAMIESLTDAVNQFRNATRATMQ